MAESSLPLEVQKIKDPRIDVVNKVYFANQGGANVTQYQIASTTSTNNQILFTTTTPSPDVFGDFWLKPHLQCHIQLPEEMRQQ